MNKENETVIDQRQTPTMVYFCFILAILLFIGMYIIQGW
jgi:hypothetical protein